MPARLALTRDENCPIETRITVTEITKDTGVTLGLYCITLESPARRAPISMAFVQRARAKIQIPLSRARLLITMCHKCHHVDTNSTSRKIGILGQMFNSAMLPSYCWREFRGRQGSKIAVASTMTTLARATALRRIARLASTQKDKRPT